MTLRGYNEKAGEIVYEDLSLFAALGNSEGLQALIKALPARLLDRTEHELAKRAKPDDLKIRLKISFWDEFRRAQRTRGKPIIKISNVMDGICSKPTWQKLIKDQHFLAWLISPPPSEIIVQKQLLQMGMDRIREVLEIPVIDTIVKKNRKTGEVKEYKKVNTALIKEVRAIVDMLQNRVYGSIIQRAQVDQRSVNLNLDGGKSNQMPSLPADPNMDEIDRMLTRIEKVTEALPPKEEDVIDVSSEEETEG